MSEKNKMFKILLTLSCVVSLIVLTSVLTNAQSRPRKVKDTSQNTNTSSNQNANTKPKEESLLDVVPTNSNSASKSANSNTSTRPNNQQTNANTKIIDATPTSTTQTTTVTQPKVSSTIDTTNAFNLLQQKQYDAALKEAKRIIALDPKIQEAWKIAGFAEFNLKQYKESATDLQKALDLLRAAKEKDDENIVNALAQAYALSEQFEKALPLLVSLTAKTDAKPDVELLYLRGLSEYQLKKPADAEKTFNAVVKADPKNSAALYYIGLMGFERNDFSAAIAAFLRTTQADPKMAAAWERLTISYMQRAAIVMEEDEAKAKADYEGAVSAAEGFARAKPGNDATALLGQVLVSAGNYQRAVIELEKVTAGPTAKGETLYFLGVSYSRLKNFPKASAALERAGAKNPKDANVFRELGYVYENLKQYGKAVEAYEKGAKAAPDDPFFMDRANQLKPFVKKP